MNKRKTKKTPYPKKQGKGTSRPRNHTGKAPSFERGEGVFYGTKNGYGFVKIPDREDDIFIPQGASAGAIDKDKVAVRYRTRFSGSKTEGEVVKILEPGRKTAIGTLMEETVFIGGKRSRRSIRYTVIPDDTHISIPLYVEDISLAKPGDKVEVSLENRHPGQVDMTCRLLRSFGRANSRLANYEAILAECGVPIDFSPQVMEEAEIAASQPISEEGRVRLDRDIIFTIDGADAKDLDDAISLKVKKDGTYVLGVHIADVSHYVTPKTHLDAAGMERGTSLYFTDKVVPMLPVALSNNACSLHPGGDKYALSCFLEISPQGDILKTTLQNTIINSRVKGVYSEVNDLFDFGKASEYYEKYREVYPSLTRMYRLYTVLKAKSEKRGALELERAEAKILLDHTGMPTDIVARERGDGEKLIEQFMLAANEGVATLLTQKGIPCVYRIHEPPSPERLEEFFHYCNIIGLNTAAVPKDSPSGGDFARLLEEAKERGLGDAVSYSLLRSMAKAKYSEHPVGHYGLGIGLYAHFTSPIRRLSDLSTHRIIKACLLGNGKKAAYSAFAAKAAMAATETELRALTAERRIESLYKTLYLSRHVGESFVGRVSSVTSFGVFVELPNTCEGLIPISELPFGFWTYDEGNYTVHSSSGEVISLGDTLEITVEEADISRGKVRFQLVRILEHISRTVTPSPVFKEKRGDTGREFTPRPLNRQHFKNAPKKGKYPKNKHHQKRR